MGIFRAHVVNYHWPPSGTSARNSFSHYITQHKKTSLLVSSVLLISASGWAAVAANGHVDVSGTDKNMSVQVQSTSNQPSDKSKATSESSTTVQSSTHQTNTGGTATQVNVNGQNIPVPQNGTVEKTIPGNNNQSDVHITIDNHTSSNSSSSSSSSLNIRSHSTSKTEGGASEE